MLDHVEIEERQVAIYSHTWLSMALIMARMTMADSGHRSDLAFLQGLVPGG